MATFLIGYFFVIIKDMKEVILTGIRANEEPTLGNLLGGILPIIRLAKKHAKTHQINMFVPDLHSFTTPIDHSKLFDNTIHGIKYYIAAGLDTDNENVNLYRQSFIPAHSELCWILNCFAPFGQVSRMTQFKDKSQGKNDVTVGLFDYPILMAADILLYDAKWVPLGEDQFQHLELTRDLAQRFNNKFGDIFTIPENTAEQVKFIGWKKGLRIRDLVNPEKKMSKSSDNAKSKINLSDSPEIAKKKIMSATTDNLGIINYNFEEQPGISSLLEILALLSDEPQDKINAEWCGKTSYGEFKQVVATVVADFLSDFQEKVAKISDEEVFAILEKSEQRMKKQAEAKLYQVQTAIGIRKR